MKTKRKRLTGAAEVLLGQLTHGPQIATRSAALGCVRTINCLVRDGLAKLDESKGYAKLSITAAGTAAWNGTVARLQGQA